MIYTEVHDLREMMTTHINNTAADRRRCPSRNAISSSPLSGDVFTSDSYGLTGAAKYAA